MVDLLQLLEIVDEAREVFSIVWRALGLRLNIRLDDFHEGLVSEVEGERVELRAFEV